MTHPHPEPEKTVFHIKVNTEEKAIDQPTLTYDEICRLAFPQGPFGEKIHYTVTYQGPHGREGNMVAASAPLQLENGLKIYVENTDQS